MNEPINRVGIMADSHGRPSPIKKALDLFRTLGCQRMYHLGDVCDSMTPETADPCADLLREAGVLAVKGNNDHAVVMNQWGMNTGLVREDTLVYLKELPKIREWEGADLAHSMPFVKEMGLSAMIGTMGEFQTLQYFAQKPNGLFFRGHSHDPSIASMVRGNLAVRTLEPGRPLSLADHRPCVVTCGALTRGYATLWDLQAQTIQCYSIA